MTREEAKNLIRATFESPFSEAQFNLFCKNLLNDIDESKAFEFHGNYIWDAYREHITQYKRVGQYSDPGGSVLDVLVVKLKKEISLERARTMQRNFIARYLKERGDKDNALVAFYHEGLEDWRFSYVKRDYKLTEAENGKVNVKEELSSARRLSFLVGKNEPSHTAQQQLVPILQDDKHNPTLQQLEQAFNIETVTKEFYEKYRQLYLELKEELDQLVVKDEKIKDEFSTKNISSENFAKKLLGQIVFLYFLQKKGWMGIEKDERGIYKSWGTGPKNFLRKLFSKDYVDYGNFFDEVLEPLFYQALRIDRGEVSEFSQFNCKIPFLNGGLFEPTGDYSWEETRVLINNETISEILDTFDLYNFTVKEDEPLDKEVAVDPEMLGKVFENLLEVKDRKSKGTYYTPREIVHYMCQESLINYLDATLNTQNVELVQSKPIQQKLIGKPDPEQSSMRANIYKPVVPKEDIENFIRKGEAAIEHDSRVENEGRETRDYSYRLPESIRRNAMLIDGALAAIQICDPAIGSGAFPVGMMQEIIKARGILTTYLGDSKGRNAYDFKRHCIQESLYGVDIDSSAVDISKLRLWLSLVVDEDDFGNIKPLPNLDYKIVCGNSLLGINKELKNWKLLRELELLKRLYFEETSITRKLELKKNIDETIDIITEEEENFDFNVYFSEVFHEKGGFDIVIANPPYLSAIEFAKLYSSEYRKSLNLLFESAKGTYDLYILFMEKGAKLMRNNGILSFITPNKYLSAKYAFGLRKYISQNTTIEQLVDVSGIPVFEQASVYPVVTFLSRKLLIDYNIKLVLPIKRHETLFRLQNYKVSYVHSNKLKVLPECIWGFLLSDKVDLLVKFMEGTTELSSLGKVNATSTASESDVYGLLISDTKGNDYLKLINTGTIDPFISLWGKVALKHGGKKFLTPYLPLDNSVINKNRVELYKKPKVIFAKMAKECEAFLDVSGEYASLNTNCFYDPIPSVSLKFIVAFCNSKIFMFFYNQFFGALRMSGGYYQFQSPQLRVIPCKVPPNLKEYEILVDKLTNTLKNNNFSGDKKKDIETKIIVDQINAMFYKLYELKHEEITILEKSV